MRHYYNDSMIPQLLQEKLIRRGYNKHKNSAIVKDFALRERFFDIL